MHLQLSFLGRVRGERGSYQEATYRFPEGREVAASFFGEALRKVVKPERLVVFGTSGSMWQVLLGLAGVWGEPHLELCDELEQACDADRVVQEMLDRLAPLLASPLGCEVRCRLLPYGKSPEEQRALVRILAEEVPSGARVTLDVTHGLRHLAMLTLVAARYLRVVKGVEVASLYYGAFDLPRAGNGAVPVLDLAGLLDVAGWVDALAAFDRSGNYAPFAALYADDGVPSGTAKLLADAAFFERNTSARMARAKLSTLHGQRDRLDTPVGGLFADALLERIDWFRLPDRAAWEARLAWTYLEKGDYLRAALYGQEAYLSREVANAGDDVDDFKQRDRVRDRKGPEAFRRLKYIRNALAHGQRPYDGEVWNWVKREGLLHSALRDCFEELLLPPSR